jgi:hypothetical protein
VYAALAADAPDRQRVYRRLFASVPEEELRLIRESLDRGFPLGGAEFMESLRVQAGFPAGHCGKPRGRRKAEGPFLQAGNGV